MARNLEMMKILVIDDEASQREILADILCDAGYRVDTADGGESGLRMIYRKIYPVILTDLKMPGKDGLEVLKEVRAYSPDIQVVLMTAFGSIPSAVNAIKTGAYDYLTKPFQKEDLLRIIGRAVEKAGLVQENRQLKNQILERYGYHQLIGKSRAMQEIYHLIDRIKDIEATVLITGESGTGKELVARAIHFNGLRKDSPFVAVNCGAIPENLIESELFGHRKGAFTGAVRDHTGKFETAQNGTIFLDEIGAMPTPLQVRLLRVLQERQIEQVGGNEFIKLNVRVIAATNENLQESVRKNSFRMDLYHRLNVFSIEIPPLRERREDLPLLTKHFMEQYAKQYGKPGPELTGGALEKLEKYHFPGNVRELSNIIEKSMVLTDKPKLSAENLMLPDDPCSIGVSETAGTIPDMELNLIKEALRESGGSIKQACKRLGISYKTLQYRIRKYHLDKKMFKK